MLGVRCFSGKPLGNGRQLEVHRYSSKALQGPAKGGDVSNCRFAGGPGGIHGRLVSSKCRQLQGERRGPWASFWSEAPAERRRVAEEAGRLGAALRILRCTKCLCDFCDDRRVRKECSVEDIAALALRYAGCPGRTQRHQLQLDHRCLLKGR